MFGLIVKKGKSTGLTTYRNSVPSLFARTEASARRTFEFFTVAIRNPNTRRSYARGAADFADWCGRHGITEIGKVQPIDVAAYIEGLKLAAPSVTQRLAALRMLFDWLVVGQVMVVNPAASVRGPRHSGKTGATPVLSAEEVRAILDAIDITTPIGLRDRALLAFMVYTFARVGAATGMRIDDIFIQNGRTAIRLKEKGGKRHEMPCHPQLVDYLKAYIQAAPGVSSKGWLFRTCAATTGMLTDRRMAQADVYRMIGRRAEQAGVRTRVGCHSFRATGITEYLKAGGRLEVAQLMANHESARTTALYDRRIDRISLDEIERLEI